MQKSAPRKVETKTAAQLYREGVGELWEQAGMPPGVESDALGASGLSKLQRANDLTRRAAEQREVERSAPLAMGHAALQTERGALWAMTDLPPGALGQGGLPKAEGLGTALKENSGALKANEEAALLAAYQPGWDVAPGDAGEKAYLQQRKRDLTSQEMLPVGALALAGLPESRTLSEKRRAVDARLDQIYSQEDRSLSEEEQKRLRIAELTSLLTLPAGALGRNGLPTQAEAEWERALLLRELNWTPPEPEVNYIPTTAAEARQTVEAAGGRIRAAKDQLQRVAPYRVESQQGLDRLVERALDNSPAEIAAAAREARAAQLGGYATPDEAWEGLQSSIQADKKIQAQAAAGYYYLRNEEGRAALAEDEPARDLYSETLVLDSDLEKLRAVLNSFYEGRTPETEEYARELGEKYGLSETAWRDYGMGKESPANDLRRSLVAQMEENKRALAAAGYPYEDFREYEARLERQEEYERMLEEARKRGLDDWRVASIESLGFAQFQWMDYLDLMRDSLGHSGVGNLDTYIPPEAATFWRTGRAEALKEGAKERLYNEAQSTVVPYFYDAVYGKLDGELKKIWGPAAPLFAGLEEASTRARDAVARGATSEQALVEGLAAGATRAGLHQVDLTKWIQAQSPEQMKPLLKSYLREQGINIAKDGVRDLINNMTAVLYDVTVMGDSSAFGQAVKVYREMGLLESEAQWQALLDCLGREEVKRLLNEGWEEEK